jgi:formylmethanofuran dehydrogenase subunit E
MATLDELLREAERAHGHLCAGQVLGVRMAMLALERLGIGDPRARLLADGSLNPDRKRLVTFVEIDRCATDAIGVVTGCRVGKRALKLRDWGKMAATFVDLNAKLGEDSYKGLRVVALESSKGERRSCIRSWRRTRSR